jgi:hypothetical protein
MISRPRSGLEDVLWLPRTLAGTVSGLRCRMYPRLGSEIQDRGNCSSGVPLIMQEGRCCRR